MRFSIFSLLTPLVLLGCLAAPWPARAQIDLATKLAHRMYLQFEPVYAETEIQSRIGQPVVFNASGSSGPTFYFLVRDDYGTVLPMLSGVTLPGPVMVAAQDQVVFTNDMSRLFTMKKPGQYSIQPCVDWMGKTYSGEKQHVEIVSGREVSRITGAVPEEQTTRTYRIFHINRGQQDHILLRIDNEPDHLCYGVYPLGRSVMNEQPELAVDGRGQAHILFQSAPRTYTHAVYTPRGGLVQSRTFDRDYSLVSLEAQPSGAIEAIGRKDDRRAPPMIHSILDNR